MSDEDLPDYEALVKWIESSPMTWLPGLLFTVCVCCFRKNVFRPKGMEQTMERAKAFAEDPAFRKTI